MLQIMAPTAHPRTILQIMDPITHPTTILQIMALTAHPVPILQRMAHPIKQITAIILIIKHLNINLVQKQKGVQTAPLFSRTN